MRDEKQEPTGCWISPDVSPSSDETDARWRRRLRWRSSCWLYCRGSVRGRPLVPCSSWTRCSTGPSARRCCCRSGPVFFWGSRRRNLATKCSAIIVNFFSKCSLNFLYERWTITVRHCGLVVSAPAWDGTGCEFDSWQCRIYIPCSLSLRLLGSLRGSWVHMAWHKNCVKKNISTISLSRYGNHGK